MTFDDWFLKVSSWGLTHDQLVTASFTAPGNDPGDVVYTSPSGSVMTRHICSHWINFYGAAQFGWSAALSQSSPDRPTDKYVVDDPWCRPAAQPQTPLGPCTQAEIDAWIETIDSKNSRLLLMWMDRALKAEAALSDTRPDRGGKPQSPSDWHAGYREGMRDAKNIRETFGTPLAPGEPQPHGCKRSGGFVDTSCTAMCDCHVTLSRPR